jgi:hypothetical protein
MAETKWSMKFSFALRASTLYQYRMYPEQIWYVKDKPCTISINLHEIGPINISLVRESSIQCYL